ncbi:MAG: dTDP-4-dehydrorhamnose reductase [Microgenomates group bacterium Gr01-1014_7]|nr:MAG: dTDP-4-dehydrorhamnose reductase [Microgenomates group bacterium Gr01-1014_7]
MLKVLIFGGSGLIGSRVRELLSLKYQIVAPSHLQIDVSNNKQIEQIIKRSKPNYIIYAAGLTSMDEAEKFPELAYSLNVHAPAHIAKFAASMGIPILYFSTDAVFDGSKSEKSYTEDDKPHPVSSYGKSKLLGEQMVMNAFERNCIVRVIMVYSRKFTKRKRFVQTAIETLKKGEKFYGVIDQVVNPIYVDDVVAAVDLLLESGSYGIYHLGARDYVTNYEFVKKLAKIFNLNENLVKGISFEEFFKEKNALRTKFCWLDTSKFRKKFGENVLHSIDEGLYLFKSNFDL